MLQHRRQACQVFDQSSKAAPGGHRLIIARGRQRAAVQSVGTERAQLDLVLGVPTQIVSDDGDKGQILAHRRFKFRDMKAQCAVAHQRNNRGLWIGRARGHGIAEPATNRPRYAVDHAPRCAEPRLRPLAKLATVTDQNGPLQAVQDTLHRSAKAAWMDRILSRDDRGALGNRRADPLLPVAGPSRAAGELAQRLCHGARFCLQAQREARTNVALCPIQLGRVCVDQGPICTWCHRSKLQRKVQGLAQQQDAIRFGQQLSDGTQRGVFGTPRALGREDRRARGQRQTLRQARLAGGVQRRPQNDDGRLAPRQPCRQVFGIGRARHRGSGLSAPRARRSQDIGRQRDMDRPRTARGGQAQCLVDRCSQRIGVRNAHRPLGDRLAEAHLVHFLKGALAVAADRAVAAQQQQGRVRSARGQQGPHSIAQPCPRCHQRHTNAAGQLRVAFGHIDRCRLVAGVIEANACLQAGIEQRHDLVTRQGEDIAHPLSSQGLHDAITTSVHR